MKNLFFSTLFLFISNYCFSQTGIIQGNVFWKYNDYVGNKPDAGSRIYLYSKLSGSRIPQNYKSDINGNFKIENLPSGKYFIIIVSKNTNMSIEEIFQNVFQDPINFENIIKYLGFNIKEVNRAMYDSVLYYKKRTELFSEKNVSLNLMNTSGMKRKELKNLSDSITKYDVKYELSKTDYHNLIEKYFTYISRNLKDWDEINCNNLGITLYEKVHMEEIAVSENRTSQVVVDFGITYRK